MREGITTDRIHFVGNVMIDTLLRYIDQAMAADVPSRYGLRPRQHALLTLHRPSNRLGLALSPDSGLRISAARLPKRFWQLPPGIMERRKPVGATWSGSMTSGRP